MPRFRKGRAGRRGRRGGRGRFKSKRRFGKGRGKVKRTVYRKGRRQKIGYRM